MTQVVTEFFANYSDILSVVLMSLFVSLSSTIAASVLGFLLGIPAALHDFKGKKAVIRVTSTLMSLPPVLMGLVVYLLLSKRGPLGSFGLLFTPAAMIIAQTLLVLPIIFGLTVSNISKTGREIQNTCISLGAGKSDTLFTIIKESRIQLLTVITAGFGRALSEVGAVMMVGGNIKGFTRVMTTYIALETGKGNFNEAIIIGIILLVISFIVTTILFRFQGRDY
jgi:tungstate transport system permease protein